MGRLGRMMAKAMDQVPRREKWPQARVELPPEQLEELMRLYRRTCGANASSATKAGLLRTALLEWWERQDPEPGEAIEATAVEVPILRELLQGGDEIG